MSSVTVENYLKAIYQLQEEGAGSDAPAGEEKAAVSTSALAERLGLAPATVTNMIQRLGQVDLIVYTPYQGVRLTQAGEKMALHVIRRHRLLELYLAEKLGLRWDEVHAEAEQLEHHISPTLEARIAAALGDPQVDPHGHPIPSPEGEIAPLCGGRLHTLAVDEAAIIVSVNDENPELLRYLAARGLYPGVPVVVTEREAFGGPIHLRVGTATQSREQTVSVAAAEQVRVIPRAPLTAPSADRARSTKSGGEEMR